MVGLLVAPRLPSWTGQDFSDDLHRRLQERFPQIGWRVVVVHDAVVQPPADDDDLVAATRVRLLDHDWDLAICLTDIPVQVGRRPVQAHASPLHCVGLLSVPALGVINARRQARDIVIHLIAVLAGNTTGGHCGDGEATRRLRELAAEPDDAEVGWLMTARTVTGNVSLLTGMIRANRPWRLAAGLSRSLTAAVAAGVFALLTPDIWRFADAAGSWRLTGIAVAAVVAVIVTLIVGGGLWERVDRTGQRRQVALFNAATTATVIIGVGALYTTLFILAIALTAVFVLPGLLSEALAHPVGIGDYLHLAWFTSSLATVGGALGAGLETDDAVHQAAYTYHGTVTSPADLAGV
ncbi:hypothetical protein [Actinoplanes couchii]|uniref:hypothetical protein n=1 Tax=Actinoplanes couchii TaxID=403638 RepID=UPI001EF3CF0D|nr:hypothetical protein [Actinoplanes couchii]MDR6324550.1 hypothetical protein [Actinoplanes couchii]